MTFVAGVYTLSYSFGLASDKTADISSREPLTTTITLVEECDIPVLSSSDVATNSLYLDGFTYLKDAPPLRVTFANWQVSTCSIQASVLNKDGTTVDSAFMTKIDDSNWEFQTNDPKFEKSHSLVFRVASSMKPAKFKQDYAFTVT